MSASRRVAVVLAAAALAIWPAAPRGQVVAPPNSVRAMQARDLWLAPGPDDIAARRSLALAVTDLTEDRPATALGPFTDAIGDPLLGGYALLYLGRTQLAMARPADALATAQRLEARGGAGYLREEAAWLSADAATAAQDSAAALREVARLAASPTVLAAPTLQLRLGREALGLGDRDAAIRAFTSIYFDHPLSPEAADATAELAGIGASIKTTPATFAPMLARAERLFGGRLYGDARTAFDSLRLLATADNRDLIELRLLQCDFAARRYTATLAALRTFPTKSALAPEAELLYLSTVRELGRTADYLTRVKAFVEQQGSSPLVERALNDLAAFYTQGSDDEKAAETYADLYRRFPQGTFAERAAWKSGWWAYKAGNFDETIRIFESASVGMRHADLRPAWLYWAAKAHLRLGHVQPAIDGFAHTIADYRNTYYGRGAMRESDQLLAARRPAGAGPVSPASLVFPRAIDPGTPPDNATLIRHLLAAGMYDEAIGELRYAQTAHGSSPLIEASIAYALNRQGRLRPAIQTMRRAYPQFMEAGGEALPVEILTVIFPVDHWQLIQEHALAKNLDRFLVAALIAQESTFQADIRSAANAWGLMQILPSTGRSYAQRLSIRPFSTMRLTDPETNVQIGTTMFADLLKRFGDAAPALAAYNAGESRVAKWLAARPGADRDEFIDDIPFAETQNYVKRILGTAEDYRRLYR